MDEIIYDWDPGKAAANVVKHGVAMDEVRASDWDTAIVSEDRRYEYGEARFVAIGEIGARLHVLTFTPRGEAVRVISLRKANRRETRIYGEKKA
jgi:uncharacterized DUF497 family protein